MSNDPKHTPGPWRIDHQNDHSMTLEAGRVIITLDRYNARKGSEYVISHEEMVANARLVMAAPELLAALKASVEYAPHGEACTMPACVCWKRFAVAAIAQAEAL